jgi:hypothetical protein
VVLPVAMTVSTWFDIAASGTDKTGCQAGPGAARGAAGAVADGAAGALAGAGTALATVAA